MRSGQLIALRNERVSRLFTPDWSRPFPGRASVRRQAVACRKLVKNSVVKTNPLLSEVAAVSVGILEGTSVLDLAYAEDSTAEVDMNIVCTGAGKFIEIQGTAEREPFTREQMNEMLALAEKGINNLFQIQRNALGE